MKRTSYSVAGHVFCIVMADKDPLWVMLSPYLPFETKEIPEKVLFSLKVDENAAIPVEKKDFTGSFGENGSLMDAYRTPRGYLFHLAAPGEKQLSRVNMTNGYREAIIAPAGSEPSRFFALNNALMLMYAFASAPLDTLLVHASVITREGEGFLFLGKSGTGKSTHSRLWLKYIEGSCLLNDDNPVVRIMDGKPQVFGSPWSGKTRCYVNDDAAIRGIVKLRQAPENKIKQLSYIQAYAAVLPSCSCMKWEEELMTGVHRTIETLILTTGCYQLDCLPDEAAAILCWKAVKKEQVDDRS